MNTSKKLFLGFSIVIALTVLVGVIGIAGMLKLQHAGESMYEHQVNSLEYISRAATTFREARRMFNQVVTNSFYDDKKGALDAKINYEIYLNEFTDLLEKSYNTSSINETDEFTKFYTRTVELFNDKAIPLFDDTINACIYDIPDHYNKLYIRVKIAAINDVTDQIEALLLGMMDLNSTLAQQTSYNNTKTTQLYIISLAVLLVFIVVIAGIIAFFITKSIVLPINESADVLGEISNGNFNARVKGNYKGELALIKNSVNHTAEKLNQYLKNKLEAERASHESQIAKERADAVREAVMSSIKYASKIQKNLLPLDSSMENAFSEYSVIWKPRDVVGGDIYWMKEFDDGTLLCVADCTGHGTPGALLTMLIVSALDEAVKTENYHDTADIIWNLEQRLVNLFNVKAKERNKDSSDILDGCDLAVLFIAKDKHITLSSGNTNVFICDGNEVQRIKGQKLFVGEGAIDSKEDIKTIHIPANMGNKFYIASDGLFDQPGGDYSAPFGYERFKKIILSNHNEKLSVISDMIWNSFETYRSSEPRVDDFELITFKP